MSTDQYISVLVRETDEDFDHRGGDDSDNELVVKEVPVENLRTELKKICDLFFSEELKNRDNDGLALNQVDVNLEIGATGKISILGSGGSIKTGLGVKLCFKRIE